mmetsp:Transcript_42081/g.51035  ORF Transcript_42081/g.51035 Transcript_42081/m.51035 type:complete len:387 (-) Transcript_42081:190-1350(-)
MNVETYGGGLWHTWFDRELTLAGAVIVREADGSYAKKLVHVKRPLLRVPSLAIHLQSADERAAFGPNKETHLAPILSLLDSELNSTGSANEKGGDDKVTGGDTKRQKRADSHAPQLLKLLALELGCTPEDVMDFELSLCDFQNAQIWGLEREFLSSPRLDNQIHCFTCLKSIIAQAQANDKSNPQVSMIALFDHEEVGSESAHGAGSPVMGEALSRVSSCLCPPGEGDSTDHLVITSRNSFLISADVAHAVHPNWAAKHESNHSPKLNQGTVIKTNDNQRYATNAESGFVIRELGRQADIGIQEFMVRNDCPCGTTIGPIISARTGLRTVDVGIPSLSMHSIRETIGVKDVTNSFVLFREFFKTFANLDTKCKFDVCQPCIATKAN